MSYTNPPKTGLNLISVLSGLIVLYILFELTPSWVSWLTIKYIGTGPTQDGLTVVGIALVSFIGALIATLIVELLIKNLR